MQNLRWNYDVIRFWLFTQSYVASVLVSALRSKYKVFSYGTSPFKWRKVVVKRYSDLFEKRYRELTQGEENSMIKAATRYLLPDELTKEVTPEITKIAKALVLNEDTLRNFIFYNTVSDRQNSAQKIFRVNPSRFITEEGIYVKVDERTTEPEFLRILRRAKLELKIVREMKVKADEAIIKTRSRKDIGKMDEGKIKFYCLIEKEIKELVEEKKVNKNFKNLYADTLVRGAIEGVVGNWLERVKGDEYADKHHSEWVKKVNTFYREIASRYILPTPKKLPSILRLINV